MEGGGRCLIYSTRKRLERAIYLFIRATVSSVSSLLFIRRLLATAIDCVSLTSFVTAAPLDMPLNGTISSRCTRHARFEFRSLVAGHTAGYIRFNGVNSGTFHGIDVGVVFLGAGGEYFSVAHQRSSRRECRRDFGGRRVFVGADGDPHVSAAPKSQKRGGRW